MVILPAGHVTVSRNGQGLGDTFMGNLYRGPDSTMSSLECKRSRFIQLQDSTVYDDGIVGMNP